MKKILLYLFFFIPAFTTAAFLPPVASDLAMVSSAQYLATEVGVDILREGGNAIDAAVAVGYALAVVHPCCGNLGGGGFMLIHLTTGKNIFINFREKAPQAITSKDFFDKRGHPTTSSWTGYLSVGVPGTVMGLNTALKEYGTMTLKQVMAPAIHLAKQGFILNRADVKLLHENTNEFEKNPTVAAIFLKNGKPYEMGDRLIQPQLAWTLSLISRKGSTAFYEGPIAKAIVQASEENHGVLSLWDFSHYSVKIMDPIECHYRGYQVITSPPPASGVTVCEILNIVGGYPLESEGFHSAQSVHDNVEAMRYAFADRNQFLGDPDFVKTPINKLLSLDHAKKIRAQISPNKAGNSAKIGILKGESNEKQNTTAYQVIDNKGNAVSVTYTINGYFGSNQIAPGTGFFLNNELDDFTLRVGLPNFFKLVQGEANFIQANKRPMSSMSPTMLMKNNTPYILLGAAGGSTIITSIVQTIENVIDYGMDINAAVNQPRYHMQWMPDEIFIEPFAFSADTLNKLQQMGYQTHLGGPYDTLLWGQEAAILEDRGDKLYYGAADNRHANGLAEGIDHSKPMSKKTFWMDFILSIL